jgi:hypothetical protein
LLVELRGPSSLCCERLMDAPLSLLEVRGPSSFVVAGPSRAERGIALPLMLAV